MKRKFLSEARISTLVILVATFLSTKNADAATYYVAKTGSDSNSCTQAQSSSTSRLTVKAGLSCLASGDTLNVGPGTYNETLSSTNGTIIPNGTPSAYTRIVGNNGVRGTVFMAPTMAQGSAIDIYGTASYVEINGVGTDGSNWSSADWPGCCGVNIGGATDSSSIHHIRVLNGEFKNNKCGSIGLNKASDIQIIGNYLHGSVCNSFAHGMYVSDHLDRITIDGNTVEGYDDYGIQLYSVACPCVSNSIIRNNIFRNNGSTTYGGSGMSIGGTNNLVYNNIAYGNQQSGIRIQYAGANNIQVYNNTVYNNGDYGIYSDASSTNSIIKNNLVWGNRIAGILPQGGDTVSNNLTTDPLYANAAAGDFHLSAGSPAIDAGATISAVTSAFDGSPRPQGCCYDIGAYEYGSTSTQLSPPSLSPPSNLRVVP